MKNNNLIIDYINQINKLYADIDNFVFPDPTALREQKEELSFRLIEFNKMLETEEIAKIKQYIYSKTNFIYPNIYEIGLKLYEKSFQRKLVLKKDDDLLLDKLMFMEVLNSLDLENDFTPEIELLHRLNLEVKNSIENEVKKKNL